MTHSEAMQEIAKNMDTAMFWLQLYFAFMIAAVGIGVTAVCILIWKNRKAK